MVDILQNTVSVHVCTLHGSNVYLREKQVIRSDHSEIQTLINIFPL